MGRSDEGAAALVPVSTWQVRGRVERRVLAGTKGVRLTDGSETRKSRKAETDRVECG